MTSKSSELILLKPKLPQDKYICALYRLLKREQAKSITGEDPELNVKIAILYAKICAV
ncbi:MAG: hypothetical protein AAGU74_10335 [Bacillota bacterium]